VRVSDFDYELPEELIAQHPPEQRSAGRLLHLPRADGANTAELCDRQVRDFPGLLKPNDLLVVNNTRVLPARMFGTKPTGGQVEILLERLLSEFTFLAQVRTSKAWREGVAVTVDGGAQIWCDGRQGQFFLLRSEMPAQQLFEQFGHMPLPPYIERPDDDNDQERYQTRFAQRVGAVAAPTAGLHFDDDMLAELDQLGIRRAQVTLHVGAGTFQPVREDDVEHHEMHAEWLEVSAETVAAIEATKAKGGRVIAVGTTVVRALESAAAANGGEIAPFSGDTEIFIYPGYEFKVIDALLTNFHLPRSTLLMLVSALAGKARILDAYRHAVEQRYRFFSYGDAMFIE
jgi:S-adenosylmethionine:tRNA ribosyltransferase-isomerase